MTDKRQLAQKLSEIVFDMAEQDRCLSNPRLADRLYEVLVAAEAKSKSAVFNYAAGCAGLPDPAYERMITEVVKGKKATQVGGLTASDYAKMTASEYVAYINSRIPVPPEFLGTPTMKWRGSI